MERETSVTWEREQLNAREFELGRQAHDVRTMIHLHKTRIENDKTIAQTLDSKEPT